MVVEAELTMQAALMNISKIHSTRAMGFAIKGLYYRQTTSHSLLDISLIEELGKRLVQMYLHETEGDWCWFESYLTYANGILPEAMLCAWLVTGTPVFKEIAVTSFDFLLSKTFRDNRIVVVSNKTWLHRGHDTTEPLSGGEQPIDVAYTIMALSKFYKVFGEKKYLDRMRTAFSWFLGNNHLRQIIYNPRTGGCYDGLEETEVNLNQGAESTVSYLMSQLTMEKIKGYVHPAAQAIARNHGFTFHESLRVIH
jgi:hypothetical protein